MDTVRAAVLAGYADTARSVGLDPLRMLDAVGIPRAALNEPDMRFSTVAIRDLLELSARAAEDFGLRMCDRRSLAVMGPAALIAREQPTVRKAMQTLLLYVSLHNDSIRGRIEEVGEQGILNIYMRYPSPGPSRQAMELTVGQGLRALRTFGGTGWRPTSVAFVHDAPRSLDTHRRIFGSNVAFNQDFNGVVFDRNYLDRPNPQADPDMAREVQRYVDSLTRDSTSFLDRVRELVTASIPVGQCTIIFVARQLGIDPRTLQRQLATENMGFGDIVREVRLALTARYVEESSRPLAEVAELLGFSALSAFSRWHKAHHGDTPSERRRVAQLAA